jgi:glycosidase
MYSVVGEDLTRWKMDFAFVMTMPRIPQFYTGDETPHDQRDQGARRQQLPPRLPRRLGRRQGQCLHRRGPDARQREAQDFVRKLVNWRKNSPGASITGS